MIRELLYKVRKELAELFLGAKARASITQPEVELKEVLGTPVLGIQELFALQRSFLITYNPEIKFYISLSQQGDWWNFDLYKHIFIYGKEMDYIQALLTLRNLEKTMLSPTNIFSVIFPTKQGYGLFHNVANMTCRKLPYRSWYVSRALDFIKRASIKYNEFLNLVKEDYEIYEPETPEAINFMSVKLPETQGKIFTTKINRFVVDTRAFLTTRFSVFQPLYLVQHQIPELIGLFNTPKNSYIGVFYALPLKQNRLTKRLLLEVKGVFISIWKVSFSSEFMKVSEKDVLKLSEASPELIKESLLEFTPTLDVLQERLKDALNEIAGYVFTRSNIIADTSVAIEHNIIEKDKIEHYLYVTIAPKGLKSHFYAHDIMYLVETVDSIIEAKLKKMMAEGKIAYMKQRADQFVQQGILDPVLLVKKIDQILGVYPFPQFIGRERK